MKVRPAHVTDHALLRYLERVLHVDVKGARKDVARAVTLAETHEGATAVLKDGYRYVLHGVTVVTVTRAHGPCLRVGRRGSGRADHE